MRSYYYYYDNYHHVFMELDMLISLNNISPINNFKTLSLYVYKMNVSLSVRYGSYTNHPIATKLRTLDLQNKRTIALDFDYFNMKI